MKCTLLVLFVLAPPAQGGYSVLAARPRIVLLASPDVLRAACGNPEVAGCTEIAGLSLQCECTPAEGGWQLSAAASFVPILFLSRNTHDLVAHELRHIRDIHEGLARFIAGAVAAPLPSPGACDDERQRLQSRFPDAVKSFVASSQRERR